MASCFEGQGKHEDAGKPPVKIPPPVASFEARVSSSPGYETTTERNITGSSKLRDLKVSSSFTKPALIADVAAIGTDDADAGTHLIFCVDVAMMLEDARADPIQSFSTLPEAVSDIIWLSPSRLLCAGKSGVLYALEYSDQKIAAKGVFSVPHSDWVRELVTSPLTPHFASGGHDHKLCLGDISTGSLLQSVKLEGNVGSVKWPSVNQGVCVSCTLDDGLYMVFDTRQALGRPAFEANMGKDGLWTHCRYTDFHVVMGFGDGELQHIDMRVGDKILQRFEDPYVAGIGNIDYNGTSNAFLCSGLSDFSVWKHDVTSAQARLWSHSILGVGGVSSLHGSIISTAASFWGANHVVVTSSTGTLSVFEQGFPAMPAVSGSS